MYVCPRVSSHLFTDRLEGTVNVTIGTRFESHLIYTQLVTMQYNHITMHYVAWVYVIYVHTVQYWMHPPIRYCGKGITSAQGCASDDPAHRRLCFICTYVL